MCCCDSKAYKGPQYVMSFENMTNNSTISRKKKYVQPCLKSRDSILETKIFKKNPQIQCKFLILKNQFFKLGFGISNPQIESALIVHQELSEKLGHFLMF